MYFSSFCLNKTFSCRVKYFALTWGSLIVPRTFGKEKDANSQRDIDIIDKIMGEWLHTQSKGLEPQCHPEGLEHLPGR